MKIKISALLLLLLMATPLHVSAKARFIRVGRPCFRHLAPQMTVLDNGNVLISEADKSEVFNPKIRKFTPTGQFSLERGMDPSYERLPSPTHITVKLQDGRVLIIGLINSRNGFRIYNPKTGLYEPIQLKGRTQSLISPEKAILLANGQVALLQVGGMASEATIFNPDTNEISAPFNLNSINSPDLSSDNNKQILVLNNSDRILAMSVCVDDMNCSAAIDINKNFDEIKISDVRVKAKSPVLKYSAIPLGKGEIFISFVHNFDNNRTGYSIYDESHNTKTVLNNGNLLLTHDKQGILFYPQGLDWYSPSKMKERRIHPATIKLKDGSVLFLGGQDERISMPTKEDFLSIVFFPVALLIYNIDKNIEVPLPRLPFDLREWQFLQTAELFIEN